VDSLNGDLMLFAATMMLAEDTGAPVRNANAAGVVGVKAARPKKGT